LIQIIFEHFNDMSFITINTIISMPMPGIAQILLQLLLSFVYLDLLFTELWLPGWFESQDQYSEVEDEPLNDYFYDNGFSSKLVVKTLGSSFVFFVVYFVLIGIYGVIGLLSMLFKRLGFHLIFCACRLNTLKLKMKKWLFWNFTISFMLSQFPPLTMGAMINFFQVSQLLIDHFL
jgi:hypothetical protein